MSQDGVGVVLRPLVDDRAGLPDDLVIYRRVGPRFIDWSEGPPRATSGGFQDYKTADAAYLGLAAPCMSIADRRQLVEPDRMVATYGLAYGVVWMLAGELRALRDAGGNDVGQGLMRDPTRVEPWHCVAFTADGRKKSKGMKSALAELAMGRWAVTPTEEASP